MLVPPGAQKTPKELEKEIVSEVKRFMDSHGWRRFRQQSGKFSNAGGNIFQIGEKGMPDFLWLMYMPGKPGACLQLWTEIKRPGGKLREDQVQWIAEERMRGALIAIVDNIKDYCEWYEQHLGWLHKGNWKGQGELF